MNSTLEGGVDRPAGRARLAAPVAIGDHDGSGRDPGGLRERAPHEVREFVARDLRLTAVRGVERDPVDRVVAQGEGRGVAASDVPVRTGIV